MTNLPFEIERGHKARAYIRSSNQIYVSAREDGGNWAARLHSLVQNCRYARRCGSFGNQLFPMQQMIHGGLDFVFRNEDHVIHITLDEWERDCCQIDVAGDSVCNR